MGGTSQDIGFANAVDANGNQYITGIFHKQPILILDLA